VQILEINSQKTHYLIIIILTFEKKFCISFTCFYLYNCLLKKRKMEDRKAYISRLLIEKLTGAISPEESVTIDELIASDSTVKAEWEWINNRINTAAQNGRFTPADTESAWQRLRPVVTRRKLPYRIAYLSAAASVAGALAFGYFMRQPRITPTASFFARNINWTKDSVTMRTEKGDNLLNLTAARNSRISSGEVWMNVTDSSLQVHSGNDNDPQWQTLLVPQALTYKVILADGSVAKLNSGTRIKFPLQFAGDKREVYIDGEAFFTIAKNTDQPFIVHTAKTDIQVLGTSFNVNTYNTAHIRTSLVDGAVSTTSAKGKLILSPGQEAIFTDSTFTTQAFDAPSTLSWMNGIYYFHDVPLKHLSDILTRWFNTPVVFDKPELENKVFSGALLKSQPLQVFLENLELSADIHSQLKDGVVHFK
jgi:transmembrane sensor